MTTISEEQFLAACDNENGSLEIVDQYLKQNEFIPIPAKAVEIASKHVPEIYEEPTKNKPRVLLRLLQDPRVTVTEECFRYASHVRNIELTDHLLEDPHVGFDCIRYFCSNFGGQTDISKLIIQKARISPELKLACAAEQFNLKLVNQLINENVDPGSLDNSPIRSAAARGDAAIVKRLLEDPRVDPSARDSAALREALWHGRLDVIELLLDDPRVDPSACDNEVFRNAAMFGNLTVVDRLLKDPRVNPAAQNNAAFCNAAKFGHIDVVNRLLEDPRVNPKEIENFDELFIDAANPRDYRDYQYTIHQPDSSEPSTRFAKQIRCKN